MKTDTTDSKPAARNGHARAKGTHDVEDAARETDTEEGLDAADETDAAEALSKQESQGLSKPREGFGPHVGRMFTLYTSQSAELGTSVPVRSLRKDYAQWKKLQADEDAAAARLAEIKGQRLTLISGVWSGLLEIYGKAGKSAALRGHKTIVAFRKLMAIGKRAPKAAPAK